MGIFRRRRPKPQGSGAGLGPDPELTMLSVDEAARLRALTSSWFSGQRREVTISGAHVQSDDGTRYGLWNLAARCHETEHPKAWPGLVDEHFTVLLAAQDTDLSAFTDEEFGDSLRLRLVEKLPDDLDDGPGFATEWAPGISRVLVLDLPTTVISPPSAYFAERGTPGRLLDQAWQQTASLVVTEDLERLAIGDHDEIWCVVGDSVFTATLAMFLPDLVHRFEPGADLGLGVLFSLPHRHQVNYRVIDRPRTALDALLVMPSFTVAGYVDAASSVSPSVYLWLDGQVTQISAFVDNQIHVTPGPHLEPLFRQIEDL